MSLLNVKLKPDDVRMARALRREGIVVSDVVREAIRAEYERRIGRRVARRSASEIMATIYAAYPDPPDFPASPYDAHDAHAVRRAIITKLRRSAR